jgi:hypothetical protein
MTLTATPFINQALWKGVNKMSPLTEAQKRAKAKYNSRVTKVSIEFYPSDADLLQKVQEQENKQKYLKDLIRQDIEKE